MKLRWTDRSKRDLFEIGEYIARDNRAVARRWVQRLRERARKAARTPFAGRVVPEWGREDVREVFLGSYRIVYEVRRDAIHVLTVFEGHRRFPLPDEPDSPA
jgi:plasmid stabilization system protein ParE